MKNKKLKHQEQEEYAMAMDYGKCAKEIYETLGGRDNLVSAAHCATRLRLVTVDNSRIDMKKLEDIDGVKGVFSNNGQLQLIIGTGTVNKVYDEFLKISGMTAATKEEVKAAAAAKQPIIKQMIKAMGDVFVPILPAIVASGLMMGLVEALGKALPAFAGSDWYGILDLLANTAFVFLPVLIAVSAARVFGGNIFLGAVIGMIMIHPNLINAWSVGSMNPSDIPVWHLFGFSIRQVGYQGHVIPVIIAVWIMCRLEKWLHNHVPEMIDLFVTPLCTVMLTAFLTLGIIGPVFSTAENYILNFAQWIITVGHGIGAMIMGALYPFTVVCGIHHMYNVIEAGMLSAAGGLNTWMPIASAANFAQGAACLAVGLKSKNHKTKAVAIPSSLSSALGIGVTGIPGFLITLDYTVQYAVVLAVSFVISFSLTWVLWKEEEEGQKGTNRGAESKGDKQTDTIENQIHNHKTQIGNGENDLSMEKLLKEIPVIGLEDNTLYAPVKGNVVSRNAIPDETFASGILGDGVGIEPEIGVVVAPCDGEIASVTDTRHAIGMISDSGVEVLIHVGVDTVNMKGDGFELFVNMGDKVKAGQKLLTFDIEKIKAAGYSTTTAVLVGNTYQYSKVVVQKVGKTELLEKIISLEV